MSENCTPDPRQVNETANPCINTSRPPNAKELLCSTIGKLRNELENKGAKLEDLKTLLGLLPSEMTERQSTAVYNLLLKNNI